MAVSEHINSPRTQSQRLYQRAKQLIPGGTQLVSKRPEMFAPNQWPAYYRSAHGCEIVDFDGNVYLDMSSMGIAACLLGYADSDVTDAVVRRIQSGSMCSLNSPDEVQLAEELLQLHPWSENVRYARSGGEAMAIAVRIARASTRRDLVAFCGYHGWHDWYLAANRTPGGQMDQLQEHLLPGLSPDGVPSQLAGTALPFKYNQIDELAAIVKQHGKNLAAVVMEPTRTVDPQPGFLEGVRELCDRSNAVLVFDEISVGWRLELGGAHLRYDVRPDVAVFAKALANGHAMAAIIGRARPMQAAQDSFISSTYWTEGVGPAAALATLAKLRTVDAAEHVHHIGVQVREGLQEIGRHSGLVVCVAGHPALTSFAFDHPDAAALQTLFTVRMLDHGILTGAGFNPSLAHQVRHVDIFLAAAEVVFDELADAAHCGDAAQRIGGFIKHSGFARLT